MMSQHDAKTKKATPQPRSKASKAMDKTMLTAPTTVWDWLHTQEQAMKAQGSQPSRENTRPSGTQESLSSQRSLQAPHSAKHVQRHVAEFDAAQTRRIAQATAQSVPQELQATRMEIPQLRQALFKISAPSIPKLPHRCAPSGTRQQHAPSLEADWGWTCAFEALSEMPPIPTPAPQSDIKHWQDRTFLNALPHTPTPFVAPSLEESRETTDLPFDLPESTMPTSEVMLTAEDLLDEPPAVSLHSPVPATAPRPHSPEAQDPAEKTWRGKDLIWGPPTQQDATLPDFSESPLPPTRIMHTASPPPPSAEVTQEIPRLRAEDIPLAKGPDTRPSWQSPSREAAFAGGRQAIFGKPVSTPPPNDDPKDQS